MMLKRRQGFTIIELLTVIAIIGVLAALIFPIASSAKRSAQRTQCMNNLMQIHTALKEFQLDEHRYPDFIAGPAGQDASGNIIPLDKSSGMDATGRTVALYPEYIKSVLMLKCPLSSLNGEGREYTTDQEIDVVDDPLFAYWSGIPDKKSIRATATAAYKIYVYDSYDSQFPRYGNQREAHYAPLWFYSSDPAYADSDPEYARQLWWRVPPEDTVVTWCSFHRDSTPDGVQEGSREVVLFLDGHVKLMSSSQFEDWKLAWRVSAPR